MGGSLSRAPGTYSIRKGSPATGATNDPLKATPPAEGFAEVLYPGELEYRTEQRRRAEGIPVEEATWVQVAEVAKRFGLDALLVTA